jgi:hypothetical protein
MITLHAISRHAPLLFLEAIPGQLIPAGLRLHNLGAELEGDLMPHMGEPEPVLSSCPRIPLTADLERLISACFT